jgi:putative ABC transport system substrate-binding protein
VKTGMRREAAGSATLADQPPAETEAKNIMTAKILIWLQATSFLATFSLADAQQPVKVPRIGNLSPGSSYASPNREAFRQGLRDLGYVEGKNILIEYRYAEGKSDRLRGLAAELVRLKVDVIVTTGGQASRAAKATTTTIPIVFTLVSDPVGEGLVASLARPGGNLTGLSSVSQDLSGKRLELLKEAIPKVSRVAVLYDPNDPAKIAEFKEIEVNARPLGVQLQSLEVRSPDEFESAFKTAIRAKAAALLVLPTSILITHRKRIAELATKNRLPAMFAYSQDVDAGGLMSYGPDFADLNRRAATYVDKILKGTKPADLPVEQPIKFHLGINLKAAKQIGLTIPPNVLARADRVMR